MSFFKHLYEEYKEWCTDTDGHNSFTFVGFLLIGAFLTYKCISNLTTHTFDGASVFILLLLFVGVLSTIRGIYGLSYLDKKASESKEDHRDT